MTLIGLATPYFGQMLRLGGDAIKRIKRMSVHRKHVGGLLGAVIPDTNIWSDGVLCE